MSPRTASDMPKSMYRQYHPFEYGRKSLHQAENRGAALQVASDIAKELYETYGASKVVLFGSLARDEFYSRSDIDLAVWGIAPAVFYRAVAFVTGYSDTWTVDLVDAEDCSEALRHNIDEEGVAL